MQYRAFGRFASVLLLASLVSASTPAVREKNSSFPVAITVFKDPNCGCCKSWVEHLRKHGFNVIARDTADLSGIKRTGRVPPQLQSCHTAFVNGYVVEGHVPAADIERMLQEKPKVAGIAVPGMPTGSPGMEVGSRRDPYEVIAFNRDGSTHVFARH